jgi:hypothetical protein
MSDPVVFPEAKIGFRHLVEFLLDRGAHLCIQGSAILLRKRIQTPVGTPILEIGSERVVPILTVAKPGRTHNSLSLKLHWADDFQIKGRHALPPNCILVPPLGGRDSAQSVVIKLGINDLEAAYQAKDNNQNLDIRQLSEFPVPWDHGGKGHWPWFATAVTAVFGFADKVTTKFKPNLDMLYFAHMGVIPLHWMGKDPFEKFDNRLPAFEGVKEFGGTHLGEYARHKILSPARPLAVNDQTVPTESLAAMLRTARRKPVPGGSTQNDTKQDDIAQDKAAQDEPAQGHTRVRESVKSVQTQVQESADLEQTVQSSTEQFRKMHEPLTPFRNRGVFTKYITIQDALVFCLHNLKSDQTREIYTQKTGSSGIDVQGTVQSTAEKVLQAMISDEEFAESVFITLDVYERYSESQYVAPRYLSMSVSPMSVNCALLLIAIIGLRAEYLLSGEIISDCLREREYVYIT